MESRGPFDSRPRPGASEFGTTSGVTRWNELLTDVEPEGVRGPIARCLSGEVTPSLGVMQALRASGNLDRVKVAVELVCARLAAKGEPEALRRCREMARSLPRSAKVRAGLRAVVRENGEYLGTRREPGEAIEACRRLFDRAVEHSEEASVALCSLGDPFVLARATAEVVDLLDRWNLLSPERAVLQIGCGTGRFEATLAPRVRAVTGVDVSERMVEAATRRCAGLTNVTLHRTSGQDLAPLADASFDLVYVVDTFPYIVAAGEPVVRATFREIARVLRRSGDLAIFNYSYRHDAGRDRLDVAEQARANGFEIVRDGETPFVLWDGLAFHLRAPGAEPRT